MHLFVLRYSYIQVNLPFLSKQVMCPKQAEPKCRLLKCIINRIAINNYEPEKEDCAKKLLNFLSDLIDAGLECIYFHSKDLMREYIWIRDRIIEV